jgi:hypothetical protein
MKGARKLVWIFVVLGIAVAMAFLSGEKHWSGRFLLEVTVRSESSQPIHAVSYAACFDRADAEWTAQTDDPVANCLLKTAEIVDGRPFTVDIPCDGREWLGFQYGYTQRKFLVLRVDYTYGEQVRTIEEIPAGRGPRSMTVTVP